MTDHKPKPEPEPEPETRLTIWLDIAFHGAGMLLAVCLIVTILLLQQ